MKIEGETLGSELNQLGYRPAALDPSQPIEPRLSLPKTSRLFRLRLSA